MEDHCQHTQSAPHFGSPNGTTVDETIFSRRNRISANASKAKRIQLFVDVRSSTWCQPQVLIRNINRSRPCGELQCLVLQQLPRAKCFWPLVRRTTDQRKKHLDLSREVCLESLNHSLEVCSKLCGRNDMTVCSVGCIMIDK